MKIIFESNSLTIASSLNTKNTPKIDGVFFNSIKNFTLGQKYNLSLVFIGRTKAKKLNLKYRQKNYATDILSFDLDKDNGEIYIYPVKAGSNARMFKTKPEIFLNYLFVHGLAHLKGYDHKTDKENQKMHNFEKKVCQKFKIDASYIHN